MSDSVVAYDVKSRVARYDADMDLMHPHRRTMAAVMLEFLPLARGKAWHALDLGCGTGFLSDQLLNAYPFISVVALDGALEMIKSAKERLARHHGHVAFMVTDFRDLPKMTETLGMFDIIVSSYGLHHLDQAEKLTTLMTCKSMLNPGGWFFNLDLIDMGADDLNARTQELHIQGIVTRAAGRDARFTTHASTRAFIRDLEETEKDQPMTLETDISLLRQAGFCNVSSIWREYREAVICAQG